VEIIFFRSKFGEISPQKKTLGGGERERVPVAVGFENLTVQIKNSGVQNWDLIYLFSLYFD
jgi:hypothetical protein